MPHDMVDVRCTGGAYLAHSAPDAECQRLHRKLVQKVLGVVGCQHAAFHNQPLHTIHEHSDFVAELGSVEQLPVTEANQCHAFVGHICKNCAREEVFAV